MGEPARIRPQPGPQTEFLSCPADIAIYGGAAGGGKSYALLLDLLRGIDDPHFRGVIFRRTLAQIRKAKGLLQDSQELYAHAGGVLAQSPSFEWTFPSGAKIAFDHLQYDKDAQRHKGAQYVAVAFDELTEFSAYQFWYLLSRLRSAQSRFRPWVRASTNPEKGSWVHDLIRWWLDDDGYPIPERSGVLRYMVRDGDAIRWVEESYRDEDGDPPLSFTFIPARLADNQILLANDPSYRVGLKMQDAVERAKLMGGCWQAEHRRGLFELHQVIAGGAYMAELPEELVFARSWDWAYSDDEGADATASVKGALHSEPIQGAEDLTRDTLYLVDATTARLSGLEKKRHVRRVAQGDSVEVTQYFEQEPAAGKELSEDYRLEVFAGMDAHARCPQGDKTVRAKRWLALTETTPARLVLVRNPDGTVPDWHHDVLDQLAHFPDRPRDLIDAISQLYSALKSKVWATW